MNLSFYRFIFYKPSKELVCSKFYLFTCIHILYRICINYLPTSKSLLFAIFEVCPTKYFCSIFVGICFAWQGPIFAIPYIINCHSFLPIARSILVIVITSKEYHRNLYLTPQCIESYIACKVIFLILIIYLECCCQQILYIRLAF